MKTLHTIQSGQGACALTAEEEDEMPLLFMDALPLDFRINSHLAAIATFMADSDDDKEKAHRPNPLLESMKTKRRQTPYSKTVSSNIKRKARNETTSSDTKELQLFLSMFHIK
ncbi:hypothetical protein CCR75_004801 [Bremia lactucae]|uniref:Uncharacterized protein n=1 Tax=Bremia lactucae TaxID=4779 RepID=A0A976FJ85_BRELC|nr:hypothetical protein CCR75_004801 [Bremia lactucae]